MADDTGTIEALASWLARIIQPVRERLSEGQVVELLAEMGYEPRAGVETEGALQSAGAALAQDAAVLLPRLETLIEHIEAEDFGAILSTAIQLGQDVKSFIENADDFATALQALGPHPGASNAELAELPRRLLDVLIIRYAENSPGSAEALELLGLFDLEPVIVGGQQVVHRRIALERLGDVLTNPAQAMADKYGWGTPGFDGSVLLPILRRQLTRNGLPAIVDTGVNPPVLDAVVAEISADTSMTPPGLEIRFNDTIGFDGTPTFDGDGWSVALELTSEIVPDFSATISPTGNVTFTPPAGSAAGKAALVFTAGSADGQPFTIIGQADASRVEARQFEARLEALMQASAAGADGEVIVAGEVQGGRVVIDFSEGDGFISTLLSGIELESDFDIGMGFSSEKGLFFHGSATLEVQVPLHVDLGVVKIGALTLSVGIDNGSFPIGIATDIQGNLGPLQMVVEQIGMTADFEIAEDGQGNLGPLDFGVGFKPPVGVGVSIDAGAVRGGGYLRIDPDRGEYSGVLQLAILEIVEVTAIGIINTKMPDGSDGFAFLAIISVEFNPGIQLGFGFTLLGVGGLVGLNRSMDLDALVAGARSGSIDTILFPQDVIANAPRIISDLRTFFPIEEDVFLIGPMAKFGWGTPTLISLSLGILIEIPGNVAIVGKLTVAIPDERVPLIIINVAFMGAIEFDKKRGWFFAALYDSRVIYMTLEGGMGVLAAFGDDSNFVVSVGGFHPIYNPPALPFQDIPRIAINVLNTPVAKVIVTAYFAVTSNTVQFGARATLYFGIKIASIEGHIAFDALFQFSPFYFNITISASLSVKLFGAGLFSVRFRGSLEGTSPWHIEGTGSISVLFWDVDVDFSKTWGDKEDTKLPPISVMPILAAEFEKVENWTAKLENANALLVSLRTVDAQTELVLHPVGSLSITQRAVPLGLTLDKIGNQRPDDANRFSIETATIGIERRGRIDESFAIGQFQDLSDDQKLKSSDFEMEEAGVELSVTGNQTKTSLMTKRVVRYETIIIDKAFRPFLMGIVTLIAGLFTHFLGGNAVAQAPMSIRSKTRKHLLDEKIAVSPNAYVVANLADNTPLEDVGEVVFLSQARAQEFMNQQTQADPEFAGKAHVLRGHEVRQAA
ncbi:DUF6603 domain-containing protein [uncultured Ruegeria sp.]|uniref:DUF6603 domain-containing protein n=1 Tax=uncultured Ruegeria sp. TaxID=259304 RepID=UPI00261F691D|nr:DUF6603 domain-containing protein [uncultured Ruegeria sp.]